ncbi:MAG: RrF2 family transcriptional regulator [Spirochaetota bacterium]
MKISTRTRYGARFMIALGRVYGKGPVLMKDIAVQENISEKYLGQIVLTLKAAGLIDAHRGARGGYFLTREPSRITLLEIVEAFQKSIRVVDCKKGSKPCERIPFCVMRDVWDELSRTISEALGRITLSDLCTRSEQKKQVSVTYII